MVQFYFLTIVVNILGGLALASEYLEERIPSLSGIKAFFDGKSGIRVSIGVIAVVTGVLKLLSVTKGDLPVIGDFIPAISALLVGTALLFERYKEKSTLPADTETGIAGAVDRVVLKNQNIVGSASIIIGLLHFLIPGVLFL